MKEEEIRPKKIFDEYLQLAQKDTEIYFAGAQRGRIACPACGGASDFAFEKHGFAYEQCPACRTLFVNPRPEAAAFSRYYTESPSSKYWATTFYKETAEARREKLWKPKAGMVGDILGKYGASEHSIVDIGGGYGLFAEEMQFLSKKPVTVIEPGPSLAAICREKSLNVVEKFLEQVGPEDLPEGGKAFVSFELFEHLHDPSIFLSHLKGLMQSGDLFVFTTLSGTGLDIQVLWEESKSVSPPHHLNFLNPHSVGILLGRLGLEMLEVSTPGKLDIDIVGNNLPHIKDRFWRTFMSLASDETAAKWQDLIASSGWSSHMMVVCRKN
ncbi:MAG TPA: class I SAM-dependent methyltransferase [Burkholderiales bacterium]|nr:class I SAM-dependent methyltransferase [Burkholderiales bacterium]